ncbi:MAG: nucleoside-diphosphate sugar epimerase/dehydratase [Pseudomonadota bacterium]
MLCRVDDIPRGLKRLIILGFDLGCVLLALWLALALRMSDIWPAPNLADAGALFPVMAGLGAAVLLALGVPSLRLSAFDADAMSKHGLAALTLAGLGTALNAGIDLGAPRTVPAIFGPLFFAFSVGGKLGVLFGLRRWNWGSAPPVPVAIYGAGAAGLQLLGALNQVRTIRAVAIVDDNPALHGMIMNGLRVQAPAMLGELAERGTIRRVLIAMPSLPDARRARLLARLDTLPCEVQVIPGYAEIIEKGGLMQVLHPVSADDLLGRSTVDLDVPRIARVYAGASILITGAGGSIGSELCRQVLGLGPRRIVLYEQSEYALYAIDRELRALAEDTPVEIVSLLGSVCDGARLRSVFGRYAVDIVLHAAAYKHVPIVEENETEGVRNNVFGTLSAAEAAEAAGVPHFVMISTDKAVRPTNVMGATKRMAEMVVQDLASRTRGTCFAMVRFGNVLGSSGSVIPLFREQIASGGPVTVTHPDVTRYFMTMPEAARLVLLAGSYATGGDTFVLDMGQPVRIRDLARQMIELSGLTVRCPAHPEGDIEIRYTGLRPGEKLYEELLIGDGMLPTPHPKILRADEACPPRLEVAALLRELRQALETQSPDAARRQIERCVEGYHRPIPAAANVAAE